ncbi:RNA polymerase sigma factor [Amycolatopsis sp. BJA-103]|uniref:RNA polymerase sigma factor n=1 Tax=unclassified Amycolatopsis TaxID=2618356 RepID=UPI000CA22CA5|nr:RNA polymerase sigma factor [Amycolatopsis sp. BJA-103]AUI57363.1 RNA polymerase subunit sigma-70 [Amycolatopsis sp. BJA-103]PNE13977.1 RNA polymerase subunit sigma-70 [Amycolatopsis sp. BJA-103]
MSIHAIGAGVPVEQTGDRELWARAAGGDEGAFGELFERHAEALWNYTYRLTGSWSSAEDLASTTFLIAWRRRAEVTLVRDSALPWLYTVAANVARDEHRGARRRLRLLGKIPAQPAVSDHADSVAEKIDGQRRLGQVAEAVRSLPRSQRDVVELCLAAEVSIADAAELLGIAEVTVRAHLSRGRARLRTLLEEK